MTNQRTCRVVNAGTEGGTMLSFLNVGVDVDVGIGKGCEKKKRCKKGKSRIKNQIQLRSDSPGVVCCLIPRLFA